MQAFRAEIFHCVADPGEHDRPESGEYFEDGVLVIDGGRIADIGPWSALSSQLGDTELVDLSGKLIIPGLIDCHVHFPQIDIIAAYGEQLIDWLNRYAYPAEMRFADIDYAREAAGFFLDELLKNGTTTAAIFATVHAHSADVLFEAAKQRGMRIIAGKVLMDRNCPEELRDSPESAYADSRALIEKWHGTDRLGYAITPRFALSSTEAQLQAAGKLAAEYGDTWIHTHLSENKAEIAAVADQFSWSNGYLDVYDHFGLVRERSIFAHGVHLTDAERRHLHDKGSAVAFCPTSNLFLGSGLLDLGSLREAMVRVGIGSDVGGGTSLSILRTLSEAYKVLQLQQQNLPARRALYLATLGAAEALYLDDRIGNLQKGKEADFIVIDPSASDIMRRRNATCDDIADRLFAMINLCDDRNIVETYVNGRPV